MKGRVTEDSAGIVIKLSDEDIEQSWVEDLHAYILNNIDTPTNKWDNSKKDSDMNCFVTVALRSSFYRNLYENYWTL